MERDSFVFYASFYEAIEELPEESQLNIYRAIVGYAVKGIIPNLSGYDKAIFLTIKPQIDANNQRFSSGSKGGRPKKTDDNTPETDGYQTQKPMVINSETDGYETENHRLETQKPNVNVNDNENVNEDVYIPPKSTSGETDEVFERFWSEYPKKSSKQDAQKAFAKLNPDDKLIQVMLSSLERNKKSDEWKKDKGKYIPYPATWINGRRWMDEPVISTEENIRWLN